MKTSSVPSLSSLVLAASIAATSAFVIPTVKLCNPNNGPCLDMPVVGQGSCCGAYNISSWLSQGGIHIDTSVDYGSQPNIATSIANSGVPRENLWITSKLNVESCATDMSTDFKNLILAPLNTTYVDLLLLHHAGRHSTDTNPHPPCFNASAAGPAGPGTYALCRIDTIQAFESLRQQGLIKSWGVSNWDIRDLEQAYAVYGFYPPINQIEFHPYYNAREVVAFCNKKGILVEAYAPVGDGDRSHMRDDPAFPPIAAAHGASVGQVIMTWNLMTGADIVIPRSATPSHQLENLNLFTPVVELNETEVATISSLHQYTKIYGTQCQPWC